MNNRMANFCLVFCVIFIGIQVYTLFSVVVANFIVVVAFLVFFNLVTAYFLGTKLLKFNAKYKQLELAYKLQTIDYKMTLDRLKHSGGSDGQFTKEEIRTLVTLCHPDKQHNQNRSSVTMTQKLNAMRR